MPKITSRIQFNTLPELPDSWVWTITSEVCSSVRDGTHDTPKYVEEGVPLVTSKNLRNGYIEFSTTKNISKEDHEKISTRSGVENGDVIFAMIGTLGNPVVIDSDVIFSIKNVGLFKKNESAINSNYLGFWLASSIFWEIIKNEDFIKGSTQKFISLNHLRNIPLPLPPFNEQRRIVEKLDRLFDHSRRAREELARVSGLCDRYKQSILAAAFRGDLTADWRNENPNLEPASELLKRIQFKRKEQIDLSSKKKKSVKFLQEITTFNSENENLKNIPITWSTCQIGSIGDVCNGSTPSRKSSEYWNGNINWVSSGEVRNNIIFRTKEAITQQGYQNSSVRILSAGTVLLAMIGEGKTRGQTAILKIESTINQNIAGVIINHGLILSEYLWYWFQYQYESTREQGSGSGPQALNCQRVRELPFIVSPLEEQEEIVQRVEKLFKAIDLVEQEHQKASKLLDRLEQATLAKAFRGELVAQDPSDEPASALLERILAAKRDQSR